MNGEFYLAESGNQRLGQPRFTSPDGPAWDEVEARYLCPGNTEDRGGFAWEEDFPDADGFIIKGIETEPIVEGLYYTTLRGAGVHERRQYERVLPSASVATGQDVTVTGVPGPNPDGSWPNVEVYIAGIGFEVTYVGASGFTDSSSNNPAARIGTAVNAPIQIPGFRPVAFPPAPPNPWINIPRDRAKLLSPAGWVVVKADGPALRSGTGSTVHLLTVGYLHRWKVIPG